MSERAGGDAGPAQSRMRGILLVFRDAAVDWLRDDAPRLSAALAYYTIFSIAPLLVVLIGLLDLLYERLFPDAGAREQIVARLQEAVGRDGAELIATMIGNVGTGGGGVWATVLGLAVLLFGATGVFAQLQRAMNEVWEVEPVPEKTGPLRLLWVRLTSLGMVLAVGFLLFVSFLAQAALGIAHSWLGDALPGGAWVWQAGNFALNLAILTLLFAAIFKILPDATVGWRDVWIGAAVTAVLFQLGKFAIGQFLGRSGIASTYGAAASLVVILLWVYFSAQILLYGAEFTQAYARRFGSRIEPTEVAVRKPSLRRRTPEE